MRRSKNCYGRPYFLFRIFGALALATLMAFLFGLVVMWLWNWVMPDIFSLPVITYWQAWALVLLSHILFKSHGHHRHHRHKSHDEHWKEKFRKRFRDKYKPEEDTEILASDENEKT